jgi:hypothetical protein
VLDVSVDTHRAAVHDPPHAVCSSGLYDDAGGGGIDVPICLLRDTRFAVERGDVVHHVDVPNRLLDTGGVAKIPGCELDSVTLERLCATHVTHQRANRVAARRECPCQMSTRKAGCAGD